MATIAQTFLASEALYLASAFPQLVKLNGTASPVMGLAFDAATDEAAFWDFRALQYGLTIPNLTIDIDWYADTATSGDVVWGAAPAAISPNTDTADIETKALAVEATVTQSHLGTTGQRLHRAMITLTDVDLLATDDDVTLRIRRLGTSGSDTMTGDCIVRRVTVIYSDT
jgi:hypothetical protein